MTRVQRDGTSHHPVPSQSGAFDSAHIRKPGKLSGVMFPTQPSLNSAALGMTIGTGNIILHPSPTQPATVHAHPNSQSALLFTTRHMLGSGQHCWLAEAEGEVRSYDVPEGLPGEHRSRVMAVWEGSHYLNRAWLASISALGFASLSLDGHKRHGAMLSNPNQVCACNVPSFGNLR